MYASKCDPVLAKMFLLKHKSKIVLKDRQFPKKWISAYFYVYFNATTTCQTWKENVLVHEEYNPKGHYSIKLAVE